MERQHLARLVAQNAQTARLLGVDFVPIYRRAGAPTLPDEPTPQEPATEMPGPPIIEVPQTRRPTPAAASAASAAPSAPATKSSKPPNAPAFDTAPIPRTREAVQAALDAIRSRYEADCPHQHFVTSFNNLVFGEGDPLARLMFIGEAPGAEEDKCGRPFVGRAGQLLNRMITAMGLEREGVYISNVLKTRPPDNATPTSEEIRLCAPYLFQQIAVIQPEVIVTLGLPATRALLNSTEAMSRLRGNWHRFHPPPPAEREVAVMPTYHPAYLLRAYTADNRAKVWSDLQKVMDRLGIKAGQARPG